MLRNNPARLPYLLDSNPRLEWETIKSERDTTNDSTVHGRNPRRIINMREWETGVSALKEALGRLRAENYNRAGNAGQLGGLDEGGGICEAGTKPIQWIVRNCRGDEGVVGLLAFLNEERNSFPEDKILAHLRDRPTCKITTLKEVLQWSIETGLIDQDPDTKFISISRKGLRLLSLIDSDNKAKHHIRTGLGLEC